ncbi:MAG: hypothetical protein WEA80_03630 [Gemmatimonadaceae bacterium]
MALALGVPQSALPEDALIRDVMTGPQAVAIVEEIFKRAEVTNYKAGLEYAQAPPLRTIGDMVGRLVPIVRKYGAR